MFETSPGKPRKAGFEPPRSELSHAQKHQCLVGAPRAPIFELADFVEERVLDLGKRAIGSHAQKVLEPPVAELLVLGIGGLGDAVGKKSQQVPLLECQSRLLIVQVGQEAERHAFNSYGFRMPPSHENWQGHAGVGEAQGSRFGLPDAAGRSEEHTSELQSLTNLVCRLLLEKKK